MSDILINKDIRSAAAPKIKKSDWFYGTKAKGLTYDEYQEIRNENWFPNVPQQASNIDYYYEYEGFLPDYSFNLDYDLPKNMDVKTINHYQGEFSKTQSYTLIANKKRVSYSEYLK